MRFLKSGITWFVFFLYSRLAMFFIWFTETPLLASDVNYYHWGLQHSTADLSHTMIEYPAPVVWLLKGLFIFSGNAWFPLVFFSSMLILDAALSYFLWRQSPQAGAFWILFSLANGAIVWFRFDLVPTALTALALIYAIRRPAISGSLVALAAGTKLWPALLIAPMIATDTTRNKHSGKIRLVWFLIFGSFLTALAIIFTGWTRTISPLIWQQQRGLQIESVPATPLMWLHGFGSEPRNWTLALSRFNAWEITGPGVQQTLVISSLLMVATLLLVVLVSWRLWRTEFNDPRRQIEALALSALVLTLAIIVSNKTFSTQYLLWIGAPIAVLLINVDTSAYRRQLWLMAGGSLILALATQDIYPWAYGAILRLERGEPLAILVLVVRNIGVIALLIWSTFVLWRITNQKSSNISSIRHSSL